MIRRLLASLQESVLGSAMIIGIASIASRLLGLLRDRILFSTFGAGATLDSYFTAFKVPDFFFNILVLGALSAAFVPLFIEQQKQKSPEHAHDMARSVFCIVTATLGMICLVLFFKSSAIVRVLSFGDMPEGQIMTAQFLRIIVWALLLFGMSNVVSGILHAHRRFFVYALAPLFYNVGIIIGAIVFVPWLGPIGLAWGVVLGAGMHVLVQLPTAHAVGFRFRVPHDIFSPGVRQLLRLMPPRAFALGVTQMNLIILFALASTLEKGSRAVWQGADNLQNFPINIFGVSLALAVFPLFSEAFADNDVQRFKRVFSENFRRILFFIIPISIGTLLLRAQIVRLVYGASAFDWHDTVVTAQTLGMFALSMFAQATIPLLSRTFFAKQDTIRPLIVSIACMLFNVIAGIVLMRPFGIIGLAFAYSLSSIVQMVMLFVLLRMRHGDLDDDHIITSTWKIIAAALGMGLVVQGMKYFIVNFVDMQTFVGVLLQTSIATIGGGAVYIMIAYWFQFSEAVAIAKRARLMVNVLRNALRL